MVRTTALLAAAAALTAASLTAASLTAATPANAGVDTSPPDVGSCHALTFDEGAKTADPDPAVDCTEPHTSVTVKVVTFDTAPDWSNVTAVYRAVVPRCLRALADSLEGPQKAVEMSAYSLYWFYPSKAQRDAGATWVRCDIALLGGRTLRPLPTDGDPELGPLPLPNRLARCYVKKDGTWWTTVCSRTHQYRSKYGVKYPHDRYPGTKDAERFAVRKCTRKLPDQPFLYDWPSREEWKGGWRYAVCSKKTRN